MKDSTRSDRLAFHIANNTLAFIGGNFVYHLINFFVGILIARSLGTERYGQFSFIFVYLSFFEVFVQFGFNSIVVREITQKTKEEAAKVLGNAILLRFVLIGLVLPPALVLIRLMHYPLTVQTGVLFASFQLFLTTRSLYETIFRAQLIMIYPAVWNGMRALLNLILVLGLVWTRPTVVFFILANVLSGAATAVGLAVSSRRFLPINWQWDGKLMLRLLKESAPMMLSGYLTLLYYRIDVVMLSAMKGFADVGYYSVATRFTESLDILATSLMISVFPLVSHSFKENRVEFDRLLSKTMRGLLLVGFPMAVGGTLVARDLIQLFFGAAYAPSSTALVILFWYTFFGFFSTFLVNLLVACGRQVVDVWISLLMVLGNIAMNLGLIPFWSFNGAALATVLTEVLGSSVMWLYAVRDPTIRLSLSRGDLTPALKVNLIFFAFLLTVRFFVPLPVVVFVLLGIAAYAFLLLGTKVISLQDVKNYLAHGLKVMPEERS